MSAESWLREHDPDYEKHRSSYKDIRDSGDYRIPRQEIPWGLSADLDRLIESGEGEQLITAQRRACERCHELFVPKTPWHRFCGSECQQSARPKRTEYMRELMRARRSAC